ncbi:cytoplasmic tRNA 2-thiolation protein 2, partial [Ascosphaera atra]
MERYKLRNAPKDRRRRLLLPLSYGPGSLALLHMLDAQLHKHATSGAKRTPFDLLVLVVDPGSIDPRVEDKGEDRLLRVKEKYPRAEYTEVKLEDVFEYDKDIVGTLTEHGWAGAGSESAESNKQRLDRFRSQVVSPTSRRDIDRVLLTRLITSFAKAQD